MKLLNFSVDGGAGQFGLVLRSSAVSFQTLQKMFGRSHQRLSDMHAYLQGLPESEDLARELLHTAEEDSHRLARGHTHPLDGVKILPPIPSPPAMLDFLLTPEHLKNSALTMIKHEKPWPVSALMRLAVRSTYGKKGSQPDFRYYKCNHNAIIGDTDETLWPSFTSYLDIEAELGVVVGKTRLKMSSNEAAGAIAGYLIFNDLSARDVQWPEMMGRLGPARSKDFERGNGIGPFLVTTDEVPDPLSLEVGVRVGDRYRWSGNTSGYTAHPGEVIERLLGYQTLLPGTIIGMGTVPGCCGLDRNEWILPGELIEITFERLGTLRQLIPSDVGRLEESRWKERPELKKFMTFS